MKEPKKEDYGWHTQSGFDDEPTGWLIEGGEEAYEEAMKRWRFMQNNKLNEEDKINNCPIMEEETYLSINGASRQDIGDSALHKNKGNNSDKTWSKIVLAQAEKDRKLIIKREELRQEYWQKVENGEFRPPTRNEKLISIANGHPDNESVMAARRLLEKKGIDWKQHN